MRHRAILNQRGEDGSTVREHLEEGARRGSVENERELAGPGCPETLAYLVEWADALVGRSGVGMGGLAPLSHTEIMHWAELMDQDPTPQEVAVLMHLDAVMRHPEEEEKKEAETAIEPPVDRWPRKKTDG